jgi:hypothetical protein
LAPSLWRARVDFGLILAGHAIPSESPVYWNHCQFLGIRELVDATRWQRKCLMRKEAKANMLPHLREASPGYAAQDEGLNLAEDHPHERRRRPRTRVHWPVILFGDRVNETIETSTQNLSSCGFYCLSRRSLVAGEFLFCRLHVPSHEAPRRKSFRILECRVRVTRAEPAPTEGLFGIACRIEDYRFLPPREWTNGNSSRADTD